jgi:hypothetical protein
MALGAMLLLYIWVAMHATLACRRFRAAENPLLGLPGTASAAVPPEM